MARGDLDAAAAKFGAAHIRGPHWADPLKGEGDVLARKGQWTAAVARYDQALKFAPAWAELHQARDAAAKRGGKPWRALVQSRRGVLPQSDACEPHMQ